MRLLAIGLFSLLVTSCGQDMCIAGVGECGYDPVKSPKGPGTSTQSSSSGSGLYISATAAPVVSVGTTLEFKTIGGRGPYTYELTYPKPDVGRVDFSSGTNCIYTAPTQLTSPATRQEVRIRAKDQDGKYSIELPFLVQQP